MSQNHWACSALRPDGSVSACYGVNSSRFADRERVTLPEVDAIDAIGDDAVCVVRIDERGRARAIEVAARLAPSLPAVWWAELPEHEGKPPAVNLLAFVGHGVEPSSLLTREELREVPVESNDQLGALRWYPGTGEVDQVYVAPHARRRHVATALIAAGGTLTASRGWASFWSDGQRTAEGNRLVEAHPLWSHRAGELTHLAPPMTPFDER